MNTKRMLIVLLVVALVVVALVVLVSATASQPVVTQKETPAGGAPDRNTAKAVVEATWDWMKTHAVGTVEPMWTGPGWPPTLTPTPTP